MVRWRDARGRIHARTFHGEQAAMEFKLEMERDPSTLHQRTLAPRTVGEGLTLMRRRAHLNRTELAKRAGVAPGTIWRYETDASSYRNAHVL
jgi:hypothetical protein